MAKYENMDLAPVPFYNKFQRVVGDCLGVLGFCCCSGYVQIHENRMGVICEFGIFKRSVGREHIM